METRPPQRRDVGEPQPGDERDGQWSQHRLLAMDRRFVERVERAIERGQECPPEPVDRERS
jgi:hypothetical protein